MLTSRLKISEVHISRPKGYGNLQFVFNTCAKFFQYQSQRSPDASQAIADFPLFDPAPTPDQTVLKLRSSVEDPDRVGSASICRIRKGIQGMPIRIDINCK